MKFAISRSFSTFSRSDQRLSCNSNIYNGAIKELHAHLIRTHLHTDPFPMSDVVRSYALSPTTLQKARFVFDQIDRPTLSIWNSMIRGLSWSDRPIDAVQLYDKMRQQGLNGNNLTFIFISKACAKISNLKYGQKIHLHALKLGFESYLYVRNSFISMYAACGDLGFARKLFDEMRERDLVSWNSLICGYSHSNQFKEVLTLFESMVRENVKADAVTMVKVILACSRTGDQRMINSAVQYIKDNQIDDLYLGNTLIDMYGRLGSIELAREVFDRLKEKNTVSWNTMIMGYTKSGGLVHARNLFDKMPERDVISWTSMITGYSQADRFSQAITLFKEMMAAKIKPDEITVASVLSACAHLGTLDVGEAVHEYVKTHKIKTDIHVGNSLIDMYCKCGSVEQAMQVFETMGDKDTISWTSVVSGLAVNGMADQALGLYSRMIRENFRPNHGIFVGILVACAHAGLVEKGLDYFDSMEREHGLVPEMKHYGCVVDLLCRSGKLNKAYEFIKRMPFDPDVVVWRMLLSACEAHRNLALGEIARKKVFELDPENGGNYVLTSKAYASSGRWDEAMKMREMMEVGNVQKPTGWSSIELNAR